MKQQTREELKSSFNFTHSSKSSLVILTLKKFFSLDITPIYMDSYVYNKSFIEGKVLVIPKQ